MRLDLHNHTTLCHHASGSMESYFARALELGIDVFGFSCHAPMRFDEAYRMSLDELPCYIARVRELADSVPLRVLCGLEVDYILGREELLERAVLDSCLDYLIGSVHFLDTWGFDNPAFIAEYAKRDITQCWRDYLRSIAAMAESGYFQIVGHFDLLKVFGYAMPRELDSELVRTLDCIADMGLALELNPAGWRKPINEAYPSESILKEAHKRGIPITFGSDSHALEHVGFGYEALRELALRVGYTQAVYFESKQSISVSL